MRGRGSGSGSQLTQETSADGTRHTSSRAARDLYLCFRKEETTTHGRAFGAGCLSSAVGLAWAGKGKPLCWYVFVTTFTFAAFGTKAGLVGKGFFRDTWREVGWDHYSL